MEKISRDKPKTTAQLNKEKQEELQRTISRYKLLFNSDMGRLVIEDLKKSLFHGKTIYHEGATNADLHFHLGRQSVINQILEILEK